MSLPYCLKWKCVGSGESLSRKSSTPEQTLCLEAVRTAAWYKGSHLNSGSSSVSDSSLISLAAGWEDFLKSQTCMSSFLPQPERLRQSWGGLRPPRTWGASCPAGNGTLPADSTSSAACGLSTEGWERWCHSIQGLLAYFTCSIPRIFVSGGVSVPIAACKPKPGGVNKKASTHPELCDFLHHNVLSEPSGNRSSLSWSPLLVTELPCSLFIQ